MTLRTLFGESPARASLDQAGRTSPRTRASVRSLALGLTLALGASCSSSDDESVPGAFVVRSTNFAAASGAIALRAAGDLLAFSVSEAAQGAGGTDFNQDGDIIDGLAVRVNTLNGSSVTLDVAVDDLEFARRPGQHAAEYADSSAASRNDDCRLALQRARNDDHHIRRNALRRQPLRGA